MGYRAKALTIVSTTILILACVTLFYGIREHNRTIELLIAKTEADIHATVREARHRSLTDYEKRLQTFLQVNPEIITAFAEHDRERLYALSLPRLKTLQRENKLFSNIHFHLPDGTSFLRVNDPEHWGDNLLQDRPSLKKIHAERTPLSGFEIGVHGGFFRVIAPVFLRERYIGAMEFGLDMHQSVDIIQRILRMPTTSCFPIEHWKHAVQFTKFPMVYRGQYAINSHGDPIYAKLPSNLPMDREYHSRVEIEGSHYIVHTHQIFNDFEKREIGGLIILQDITDLILNKRHFIAQAIIFTIFFLVLGITVLHLSFNRLFGNMEREVAKREEATASMERAARQWTAAMDSESDAVYILDLDRKLIQANRAFYKAMATDMETALGRPIEEIVHPHGETAPCPIAQAQKELRDGQFLREVDDPDNSSGLPLEITVTIIRDHDDKPLSIFMRRHDLSEQRAVENRLRKSKEEWERTFDSIADLVTIQDKNMQIVRANRAAEEFFQVKRGGLSGLYCYEVFRGKNSPCQDCPMLSIKKDSKEHPPIIHHDNLQKTFHISSSPLLDADDNVEYLVHIARDITTQKALEEELYQAHKMEAIGTMAGGIAHDFNNILAAIVGFAELVRADLAEGSPSREDMDQIIQAADRAKSLVQQILSFSRKGSHQLQIFAPSSVVHEVAKLLHSTLPSTVTIEETIEKDTGTINADPTRIHQIVMNLCTNAFHAMEGEKGILGISLQQQEITSEAAHNKKIPPGNYVVLEVRDTGCGMDKTTQERIFDPFYTTKTVGKGTGMGLSVLHGIVKDYHGFIEVESCKGIGSTFRVYFPSVKTTDEPLPVHTEKNTKAADIPGSEEILVVDDDPLLVRINGRLLGDLGYRVTEMTSSTEALEKVRLEPHRFDLLITDQTMPQLTGTELAASIMKISPKTAVIMCTGHSGLVSKEDALAMGINRFVYKPIKGMELIEAVREVLNETRRASRS
ncbi:PAS domain S-box [Desulfocapsa sulfexigens DSM 10523]|uniref:histidine kinase n=2 Tax=Desulfocapsa TaxID=53318 RepID=M1NAH9_DESSD|nr:PAS domain S-box [Desulfocapsa sulfexigens DSM 10523]